MIKMKLRAVFDTNVYVAIVLSKNPKSPTVELFERLKIDEFTLLYCDKIRDEIINKLIQKNIDSNKIVEFIAEIMRLAECISIKESDVIPVIPTDPNDDIIVACAVKGKATHLVTYDRDFDVLGHAYRGIKIVDVLHFLYEVRDKN